MPGPLNLPRLLALFPFRYRDPLTGKWIRARYRAELHVIRERYSEWETTGPAEFRMPDEGRHFNPWRRAPDSAHDRTADVDAAPTLREGEASLALLFLRRYLTYCARRRRFAEMQGAARLYREVDRRNVAKP